MFCNIFLSPEFILIYQGLITIVIIFIVAYVKKTAENKAVLNNLKSITKTVEEVKKDFNTDLEFLKAELNNKLHKKNLIYSDEKDTIIDFFSQLNKWLWDGLNVSPNEFNHTNFDMIETSISKMRIDYNETNISFSKLQLLIDDKDLVNTAHTCITKTLALHQSIELILLELKQIQTSEKLLVDRFSIRGRSQFEIELDATESKNNRARRDELLEQFYKDKKEMFPVLNDYRLKFADNGKKYIKK